MTAFSTLLRLAAAVAVAGLLAACTIRSKDVLITDAEALTPLPQTLFVTGYSQDTGPTEPFLPNADQPPLELRLDGKAYVGQGESLAVRFAPLDQPDTYLLAATSPEDTTYGIAHYANSILEVRAVFNSDVREAITAAALPGTDIGNDGVMVADRATLDAVIKMVREGTFEVLALGFYVTETADAPKPKSLVREGEHLKAVN